tara:strand:- start:119 stop:319 length:201 start_codon:yes stop_codon:yes gene_type:complete
MEQIENNTCEIIKINKDIINTMNEIKEKYTTEKTRIFYEIIYELELEKYLKSNNENYKKWLQSELI